MAVRITKKGNVNRTVLQVDGRLQAADVEALQRVCEDASGAIVLELTQLWSADSRGVEAIHDLVSRGARLQGLSPYLKLLLSTSRSSTFQ